MGPDILHINWLAGFLPSTVSTKCSSRLLRFCSSSFRRWRSMPSAFPSLWRGSAWDLKEKFTQNPRRRTHISSRRPIVTGRNQPTKKGLQTSYLKKNPPWPFLHPSTIQPVTWPEMCSRELRNGSVWWPSMPLRAGDSMCQIGSHDGSMGRSVMLTNMKTIKIIQLL